MNKGRSQEEKLVFQEEVTEKMKKPLFDQLTSEVELKHSFDHVTKFYAAVNKNKNVFLPRRKSVELKLRGNKL